MKYNMSYGMHNNNKIMQKQQKCNAINGYFSDAQHQQTAITTAITLLHYAYYITLCHIISLSLPFSH
jgi:hypothetical protein